MVTTFRAHEVIRLVTPSREVFGTIVGETGEEFPNDTDTKLLVLLYPQFKDGIHDSGLREPHIREVSKRYDY